MLHATGRETTRRLGEIVLERLYETDKVAYIRFASVYRHFEDLDEFIKEARKIKKDKSSENAKSEQKK